MRKTITIVVTLLLSLSLFAGIRSREEAARIAAETLTQYSSVRRAPVRAEALTLAYTAPKHHLAEPAFYAFNHANGGFAVIAADDRAVEVLCYSEQGRLDTATMNPALKWWLARFVNEISNMTDEDAYEAPTRTTVEAIEPILGDITWDQETPYNNLCPVDLADNTRCLTGCVATAAAQIMRYWQYPMKGIGTKTYTWENYDPDSYSWWGGGYSTVLQTVDLTADYENTYYDWPNMLPAYAGVDYNLTQANAVATLMLHCGIACDMGYGGQKMGGSGALIDDMGDGMVEHFGYTYTRYMDQYADRSITTTQLQSAFNGDLEAGRPILMGGYDGSAGGHAFVCDGRDANGKFHINWGWEGDGNCYTTLSSMKPTGTNYRFNQYLDAVIGLQPAYHPTVPSDGHYATCQEANLSELGDTLFMNPVTVVYQNDAYTFLQDNTGGALLYGASYTLNPGDVVEGLVVFSVPERNQPKMRGISYESDLTVTAGTVPEPKRQTVAPTDELINQYVRYENLRVEGRFNSSTRTKLTAYMKDSTEIILYNQFKLPYTFSADKVYDIVGFVTKNNEDMRLMPILFEEKEPTAISETTAEQKSETVKVIENGRIYILRDGVRYSVLGNKID